MRVERMARRPMLPTGAGTPRCGSTWQEIPVDAVGRVEVRLVGAMPPDVFGVFVQYFFDEGDGVCEGDPAFEAFVSNPFGPEALLTLDANPETATTCANATRSP